MWLVLPLGGSKVLGAHASPAMLAKASENLAAAGVERPDLRQGAMECLPVDDASVDVVLASMSLHHAEQPRGAITEMARVLRPQGRVVVVELARHPHEWTREELADLWPGFQADELRGW